MASNLTVDTLTKGSTTLNTDEIVDTNSNQICKAWVNFNGTSTVAIRDSYNVSSVTDRGSGLYTVNFSSALANSNYSAVANCADNATDATARNRMALTVVYNTTSMYVNTFTTGQVADDTQLIVSQVFGD